MQLVVLVVSEGYFGGVHNSFCDLFCVENGKIAQYWDVIDRLPTLKTTKKQTESLIFEAKDIVKIKKCILLHGFNYKLFFRMKKVKLFLFGLGLSACLLFPMVAQAKTVGGNYLNENGCLVVWEKKTILWGLISYGYKEWMFCKNDGSPLIF